MRIMLKWEKTEIVMLAIIINHDNDRNTDAYYKAVEDDAGDLAITRRKPLIERLMENLIGIMTEMMKKLVTILSNYNDFGF